MRPAYARLHEKILSPRAIAPDAIGVETFPGGDAYYAYCLRHHSQSDLSAEEAHRLGLGEVERLRGEILAAAADLGMPDGLTIAEICERAERDGGTVVGEETVERYRRIVEEASARLPEAFDRLPSIEVEGVGESIGACHRPPPLHGTRPGVFYAPLHREEPCYRMPTVAYREAVPGHHLQIALTMEANLPTLRTLTRFNGYTEGWALYAERLAWELGWYDDDPSGNLGRLCDEMMRTVRLVVDPAIDTMDWSFDEAVAYFHENTGKPIDVARGLVYR